jgi:transposase InsO family protein
MYPDQTERSSTHFLAAAVAWYQQLGIAIQRVLTDNGPCYKANTFARSCGELGLKHRRTRAYTPRTNGKAERFIKTAINEWAYAYPSRIRRPDGFASRLDSPIQLAQTPRQPQPTTAHQQSSSRRQQPLDTPHLDRIERCSDA